MSTKEKAAKTFEFQVKKASVCRSVNYHESCCSCPEESICHIQIAIEIARSQK